MNGEFAQAAAAIFVAMIFDGLDAWVARMTNTQSEFGAEYDSMADMVSFGMAPALVAYNRALSGLNKLGYWLHLFTVSCLRLARFNTTVATADKRFFQGLPSPAAAALVAGMIWVGQEYNVKEVLNLRFIEIFACSITALTGTLMVSNFKYNSFKEVDWHGKVPFVGILLVCVVFVIVTEPSLVLFLVFALYAIAGPVNTFRNVKKVKLEHFVGDAEEGDAEFKEIEDESTKQKQ